MGGQPALVPDRQPLDEQAAASARAYAADQRAKADVLAPVLEDIAAHGYPSPKTGVPWEEARDAHPERLAGEKPRVATTRRAGPRSSWWSPR
ncbi:hypothetical protein [Streptomyces zhihengii]|uniref:hypothetical protein n=1 Tax=Streptomyces zhihengii TaxID=1818004 RepID=UPI0033A97E0C